MVEPIFDYQFRLILIGDSTVGKSSLLKYFTDGKFAEVRDRKSGRVILQLWKTN
jgi:GTPase SAR1 family protein